VAVSVEPRGLLLPGSPQYAQVLDFMRQVSTPRQVRDPVPIPDDAPYRANQSSTWGPETWPWYTDPATGWPTRDAGAVAPITERGVTGIPAAWRCLHFIANAVASCAPPIEFDALGVRVEPISPIADRPWVLLSAHEFWVQVVTSILLYGNFVGMKIDIDADTGYPRQVMPVHPSDVNLYLVDGLPTYEWGGELFGWDEVVHIRGYTSPGALWGLGVIEAFRLALAAIVDSAAYGATTYRTAAENSVMIQVDRPELSQAQADSIQQRWIDRHGSGTRRPAVVPRSMTITPLAFSPADAQFMETRHLGIAEVAYMFGMDPTDLDATVAGGRGAITYANREQREIERLTHSVGPWIRRIEQAWSDLLPSRRAVMFDVERLLRTDTATRLDSSATALGAGIFTLNDARNVERLPLYPFDWANVPFGKPPIEQSSSSEPADEIDPGVTDAPQTAEVN